MWHNSSHSSRNDNENTGVNIIPDFFNRVSDAIATQGGREIEKD